MDYDVIGSTMSEVKSRLVNAFTHSLKMGYGPDATMIWGPPGIGKTFTVYDAAREVLERVNKDNDLRTLYGKTVEGKFVPLKEVYVKSLMLSTMDPTDIVGVPHRHKEHDFTQYLPLSWAWYASKEYETYMRLCDKHFVAPPMVLFFDDFPVAHSQVQAACFKLFHEKQAGDLHLRNNVFLIAAGNRPEDNAAAQDMPTAMASRFRHIYSKIDCTEWINWASKQGDVHPLIIGFMRAHKDCIHEFDPDSPEKAFPCPRTWEMISTAIKENEQEVADSVKTGKSAQTSLFKVTSGIIGTGMANQLHAYLNQTRFAVSPEEIVKNPKKAKVPNMEEIDALHATIAQLEYHIKRNPNDWKAALIYSIRKEMMPEMGLVLATSTTDVIMNKLEPSDLIDALATKEYEEMNEKYGEFLTAVH